MKHKALLTGFLLYCFFATVIMLPVNIALNPLSFTQKVGDILLYDVIKGDDTGIGFGWGLNNGTTGDQFKFEITSINLTMDTIEDIDNVWGVIYKYDVETNIWYIDYVESSHCTYGLLGGYLFDSWPFVLPHNATAVSLFFSISNGWNEWTGGYYGIAKQWDGSGNGDLGESMMVYEFNSNGEMSTFELWNGTGSGWDLLYKIALHEAETTWIIILIVLFPLIGLGLAALILYRRRDEL